MGARHSKGPCRGPPYTVMRRVKRPSFLRDKTSSPYARSQRWKKAPRKRAVHLFSLQSWPERRLRDRLIACIGALAGIACTALICRTVLGNSSSFPLIVAPIGASAVLLFADSSKSAGSTVVDHRRQYHFRLGRCSGCPFRERPDPGYRLRRIPGHSGHVVHAGVFIHRAARRR